MVLRHATSTAKLVIGMPECMQCSHRWHSIYSAAVCIDGIVYIVQRSGGTLSSVIITPHEYYMLPCHGL